VSVKGSFMPRTSGGTFPTSLEVEGGYPCDDKVEEITMIAADLAQEWLRDVLPTVWTSIGCYGYARVDDTEDTREVYIATGGWSGCEQVINAILKNFWLRQYLHTRVSGGAYVFRIPRK